MAKKLNDVDSRIEIEKQKNELLMKEVQRLILENDAIEKGANGLKRENLDFL